MLDDLPENVLEPTFNRPDDVMACDCGQPNLMLQRDGVVRCSGCQQPLDMHWYRPEPRVVEDHLICRCDRNMGGLCLHGGPKPGRFNCGKS